MEAWKFGEEAERAIDGPVMSLAESSDLGRLGVKLGFELPRRRSPVLLSQAQPSVVPPNLFCRRLPREWSS